jgi:hypothetical protein
MSEMPPKPSDGLLESQRTRKRRFVTQHAEPQGMPGRPVASDAEATTTPADIEPGHSRTAEESPREPDPMNQPSHTALECETLEPCSTSTRAVPAPAEVTPVEAITAEDDASTRSPNSASGRMISPSEPNSMTHPVAKTSKVRATNPSRASTPVVVAKDPAEDEGAVAPVQEAQANTPASKAEMASDDALLADHIRQAHRRVGMAKRRSVDYFWQAFGLAVEVGQGLVQAKDRHGKKHFKQWVIDHCDFFEYREAANYVRFFEHVDEVRRHAAAKVQSGALFSLNELLKEIATPRVAPNKGVSVSTASVETPDPDETGPDQGEVTDVEPVADASTQDDEPNVGGEPERGDVMVEPDGLVYGQDLAPANPTPHPLDVVSGGAAPEALIPLRVWDEARAEMRTNKPTSGAKERRKPVREQPARTLSLPEITGSEEHDILNCLRVCLRVMLVPISKIRESSADPSRLPKWWAATEQGRVCFANLLIAASPDDWIDCDKCKRSGLAPPDEFCRNCGGIGRVVVPAGGESRA